MSPKLFTVKSHAKQYLKDVLKGKIEFDPKTVLKLFQIHYNDNADKVAMLHQPGASITIGKGDYNSNCFLINGVSISTKLAKANDKSRVSEACRTTYEYDFPAHLSAQRRPGTDLHHANEGGFAKIVHTFTQRHGVPNTVSHVSKQANSSRFSLIEPLRSDFIALHRDMTDNWKLVQAISSDEHKVITVRDQKKRKRNEDNTSLDA